RMNMSVKRRRQKLMKPTRTLGNSALWPNPEDPASGRGGQICQHRLNPKHAQSLVLNLKLHEQLRIIGPLKKQGLKLYSRIAIAKPSRQLRRINPKPNRRIRCSVVASAVAAEIFLFLHQLPNTVPILAGGISAQGLNALKKNTGRAVVRPNFHTFTQGRLSRVPIMSKVTSPGCVVALAQPYQFFR